MHRSKGDERPKVASRGDERAIEAPINALLGAESLLLPRPVAATALAGAEHRLLAAAGHPGLRTGRPHPRTAVPAASRSAAHSQKPQKYTAKGPRGPSMTSTGVSNTLDSTSPVMISSGAPNSMTAPSLTAQMWSA